MNNQNVFLAAFAGALTGIVIAGRPIVSADSDDYQNSSKSAFAFTTKFDNLWGSINPDSYQLIAISLACQGYWTNRSPVSINPDDYEKECLALIAAIQEGESFLISPTINQALSQEVWNIDSVNGNDNNDGFTAPIKTVSELISRYETYTPLPLQTVQVNLLNDLPSNDPWLITPNTINGTFTVTGTPVQLATTTIGVYTPRNDSLAIKNKITALGQNGAYWTQFIGCLIHDISVNAWFRIISDLGSAQAEISEPMAASTFAPAYKTIENGDSIIVYRPSKVTIPIANSNTFDGIIFQTIEFDGSFCEITGVVTTDRCTFSCEIVAPSSTQNFVTHCNVFCNQIYQGAGIFYGGSITSQVGQFQGDLSIRNLVFDGNIVITTRAHIFGAMRIGQAGFFGGEWLEVDTQPIFIELGASQYGSSVQWGTAGWQVNDGTQMIVNQSAATSMLLTGGYTIDNQTTAFPWNSGSATFGTSESITPANIDSSGSLQNPATGSRIYKRL